MTTALGEVRAQRMSTTRVATLNAHETTVPVKKNSRVRKCAPVITSIQSGWV